MAKCYVNTKLEFGFLSIKSDLSIKIGVFDLLLTRSRKGNYVSSMNSVSIPEILCLTRITFCALADIVMSLIVFLKSSLKELMS